MDDKWTADESVNIDAYASAYNVNLSVYLALVTDMTLEELARETLVQKHKRLMQAKCKHKDTYESTVTSDLGSFTNGFCWECGKTWTRKSL